MHLREALGSARGSRAGDGVSPSRTSFSLGSEGSSARAPKLARESRALPRLDCLPVTGATSSISSKSFGRFRGSSSRSIMPSRQSKHRSATSFHSAIKCVVTKIVFPRSASKRSFCWSHFRQPGSRLRPGSSSRRTGASASSSKATPNNWRIPPESFSVRNLAASPSPVS